MQYAINVTSANGAFVEIEEEGCMFTNSNVASVVDDDKVRIKSTRRYSNERER